MPSVPPVNSVHLLSPGRAFLWNVVQVLQAVHPETCKGWNQVWSTLVSTFLFFFSLGGMSFMARFYYPPPGGQKALPPSSISLHCISFLIWKYSLPFLALISGLLHYSYVSLGFACLENTLPSTSLTHLYHCWYKAQPRLYGCTKHASDETSHAKLVLLVGG